MDSKVLKIAIIGGGKRCEQILDLLDADKLQHLKAEVVGVADINPEACGFLMAQQKGVFTTRDYMDFFSLPDLDVVIEMTGNEQLLADLIRHKPAHLRVLDFAMSRICEDIVCFETQLQNKQREINFAKSYFKQLFSVVRDPIMVIQPDYTIRDANEALLDSLGLRREEVIGRKCHEISHRSIHPCSGPQHECPLQATLASRAASHAIHEHHISETKTRYYDVMAYPLMYEADAVDVVLETWRDISHTLEQQLEEKTRKIKEDLAQLVHEDKMIALGKLVASAVHEINNPIAAIHTFAKVMLRMVRRAGDQRLSTEEIQEMEGFLELMSSESKRCGDIVTNLLSFSRHRSMTTRTLSVNSVVEKILLLLKHRIELQKIELTTELAADLPDVQGDLNQLQQCIMNLIFNAMEAMPEGGRLQLNTASSGQHVRIEVCDTGAGIAPENLGRIFEPFFTTKSPEKGVGLGLAVVYGIIREHGGKIDVMSDPGKGTCFRISLPAARG